MVLHKSTSRVRFPHTFRKVSEKCVEVSAKHTKPAVRAPGKQPKAPPGFMQGESDQTLYHDCDDSDEELYREFDYAQPIFAKKRVPSKRESELNGALNSRLSAVMAPASTSSCAIKEDPEDDPSASLLMETSQLYVPVSEELIPVPPTQGPASEQSAPAQSERSSPSPSLLQRLVTVFAGRKKPSTKNANLERSPSSPELQANQEEPVLEPSTNPLQAANARAPSDSWQPRLTLPQVIPSIWAVDADDPERRPGFVNIPSAAYHKYTGFAKITEDVFEPSTVQRGFDVVKSPPVSLLAHRRNNSAASLLDRDGQTWANWHSKNPSPERMPFARVHSIEEELVQQSVGHNLGGNSSGTGQCFLEQTGDDYPYGQGLCW